VYTPYVNRHNFYVDLERMTMLRKLAAAQNVTVSGLIREAIDLVISERMNNPRPSLEERRAEFDVFVERYAGSQPYRDPTPDESAVEAIAREFKSARKAKTNPRKLRGSAVK